MKMKKWSDEEVEFLRKNYEDYKIDELAKRLNRSFYSVKRKLGGLKINKGFKFCKGCSVKWGEKEYRCDVILWLIEKYKNSNYFKYTGGFYI